jgi:hypothetical protein
LNGIGNKKDEPGYARKVINYFKKRNILIFGVLTFEHMDGKGNTLEDLLNCIGMYTHLYNEEVTKAYNYFESDFNSLNYQQQVDLINGLEEMNFIGYSGGAMISPRLIEKIVQSRRYSQCRIGVYINVANGNWQPTPSKYAKRNAIIYGSHDPEVGGGTVHTEIHFSEEIDYYKKAGYDDVHIIYGATHPLCDAEEQFSYWEDYFNQVMDYMNIYIKR